MKKPIDENMVVKAVEITDDLCLYDVRKPPFSLHGVWYDTDSFYRIPREVAERVSKNIHDMCDMTAGGRVRFATDSKKIVIKATVRNVEEVTVMTPLAVKGFDLYADGDYVSAFIPPFALKEGEYTSPISFTSKEMREITIDFPLYAAVTELYIGVEKDAKLLEAKPYRYGKPIVFYGSSITNGAAASRPGMTYEAMLSRRLDFDYHNLGFGGSAKGETAMAEYIADLDMSVFVMDYDHNAPTPEHLEKTHYPFYKIVRDRNPDTPIIFITRPCKKKLESNEARRRIIKNTYERAVFEGDERVYYINGADLLPFDTNEFDVDSVHPSDLGFYFMAEGIYPILKDALENH